MLPSPVKIMSVRFPSPVSVSLCALLVGLVTYCACAPGAHAQETETLVGGRSSFGGFGGPVVKASPIADGTGVFVGARGGWIINARPGHTFVLGGGGYGLVNDIATGTVNADDQPLYLSMSYGGFEVEYVNNTTKLFHFSVLTFVGTGTAVAREKDADPDFEGAERFFVFEPTANAIVNFASFFRAGAGVGYRFVNGARVPGLSDASLSGIAATVTFKFGSF